MIMTPISSPTSARPVGQQDWIDADRLPPITLLLLLGEAAPAYCPLLSLRAIRCQHWQYPREPLQSCLPPTPLLSLRCWYMSAPGPTPERSPMPLSPAERPLENAGSRDTEERGQRAGPLHPPGTGLIISLGFLLLGIRIQPRCSFLSSKSTLYSR